MSRLDHAHGPPPRAAGTDALIGAAPIGCEARPDLISARARETEIEGAAGGRNSSNACFGTVHDLLRAIRERLPLTELAMTA